MFLKHIAEWFQFMNYWTLDLASAGWQYRQVLSLQLVNFKYPLKIIKLFCMVYRHLRHPKFQVQRILLVWTSLYFFFFQILNMEY